MSEKDFQIVDNLLNRKEAVFIKEAASFYIDFFRCIMEYCF